MLNVANLGLAATDREQRVVFGGRRIGRIEQQAMREAGTEAGGQRPVFTLDIVNDRRAGPDEQCRNDEPDTLARTGRREGHAVPRALMAQLVVSEPSPKDHGITMNADRQTAQYGRE